MKFQHDRSTDTKNPSSVARVAKIIPVVLATSLLLNVSPNAAAGPKAYRLECNFFDGKWKRIRSGIYSCAYGYQNYNVYNFKSNTIRICRQGDGCYVIAIHNNDSGNPRSEK